jgi:hypothetical protein
MHCFDLFLVFSNAHLTSKSFFDGVNLPKKNTAGGTSICSD